MIFDALIDCTSGIVGRKDSLLYLKKIKLRIFNEGAVSSVYVGQPLDTIKTKLQTFPNQYHNFFDCTLKIFSQNGIQGFYAGTVPSLVGNIAGFIEKYFIALLFVRYIRKWNPIYGLWSMSATDLFLKE